MSRPRRRVAIAQAVLSGVLLLVVYLTLLRPDSGEDLPQAVNAERGRELEVNGSFPSTRDEDEAPRMRGQASPDTDAGLPPGPAATSGPPAEDVRSGAPPKRLSGPPAGELDEEESPTEDQYEDAVSALLERVRAAD